MLSLLDVLIGNCFQTHNLIVSDNMSILGLQFLPLPAKWPQKNSIAAALIYHVHLLAMWVLIIVWGVLLMVFMDTY